MPLAAQQFDYQQLEPAAIPKAKTLDFSSIEQHWAPVMLHTAPAPGVPGTPTEYASKKRAAWQRRMALETSSTQPAGKTATGFVQVEDDFQGNSFNFSLPNDNDIAISDSGWIVSVINTNISIFDTTGSLRGFSSLADFGNELGNLERTFDPRVVYDPVADRFIIVYLNGSLDTTNSVIVAFSETNDPRDDWHLYQLPGNPQNNGTWSDFPSIAINQNDLFIGLNTFTNGSVNNSGFIETVFWQIGKAEGYAGDSLQTLYYHDIIARGDTTFNLCPVDPADSLRGPEMYLLSNRLLAEENDSLFVFRVTNSVASGQAALELQTVVLNQAYGLPPAAKQSTPAKLLDTNDARIQAAMRDGTRIYFTCNTVIPSDGTPGIYYGVLNLVPGGTPTVHFTDYIHAFALDVAYPNIAWAGPDRWIIGAVFSSENVSPGSCAFAVVDTAVQQSPNTIRDGIGNLNLQLDTLERWGDYTGLARRWSVPGEVWFSGSYASGSNRNESWIGKLSIQNPVSRPEENPSTGSQTTVYPNPVVFDWFTVELYSPHFRVVEIRLREAATGRLVRTLYRDRLKAGTSEFRFNRAPLSAGVYLLEVQDTQTGERIGTHKVVVE